MAPVRRSRLPCGAQTCKQTPSSAAAVAAGRLAHHHHRRGAASTALRRAERAARRESEPAPPRGMQISLDPRTPTRSPSSGAAAHAHSSCRGAGRALRRRSATRAPPKRQNIPVPGAPARSARNARLPGAAALPLDAEGGHRGLGPHAGPTEGGLAGGPGTHPASIPAPAQGDGALSHGRRRRRRRLSPRVLHAGAPPKEGRAADRSVPAERPRRHQRGEAAWCRRSERREGGRVLGGGALGQVPTLLALGVGGGARRSAARSSSC